MITDFVKNDIFIVFSDSTRPTRHASRVMGPYHGVRLSAKGIWAYRNDGNEPIRVATQDNGLMWEIDGMGEEEPSWGTVQIISPPLGATCNAIEAGTDWIRPQ